jgi:hypothetical protein
VFDERASFGRPSAMRGRQRVDRLRYPTPRGQRLDQRFLSASKGPHQKTGKQISAAPPSGSRLSSDVARPRAQAEWPQAAIVADDERGVSLCCLPNCGFPPGGRRLEHANV